MCSVQTSLVSSTHSRSYRAWNDAIATEFFSGRFGGRPVYLDLEEEVLRRIGESVGIAADREAEAEFIAAVDRTLLIDDWGGVFRDHAEAVLAFELFGEGDWPPQIGLLAFQSLVAEKMRSEGDLRASNYYGRFLELLGRDPSDSNLRQKLANAFSNESDNLWIALNKWIGEEPDVRGLATAFAFDSRIHIGLPMSQALVREGDRAVLHEMFDELDLDAGQTIASEDMERLLRSFIPTSRAGKSFKKLCADNSAAPRIAEVACLELSSWSPSQSSGASFTGVRVGLSLSTKRLPRPAAQLVLIAKGPTDENAQLQFGEGDFLGPQVEEVSLFPPDEAGWRRLDAAIASDALLNSTVNIKIAGSVGLRKPRRLVLFQRQPEGPSLVEVARVRLGADHTMLVADSLREKLEAELAEIARPGFVWREALAGIPEGWSLVERVEVVAITETKLIDLNPLVPRAWTDLTIEGGLRIPGRLRRWHSGFPPEVQAISATGQEATLRISATRQVGDESDVVYLKEDFDEIAILDATILRGEDCDVRIEVIERSPDASVLNRSSFELVSASSSPPVTVDSAKLSYSIGTTGFGALSASDETENLELRGAVIDGDVGSSSASPAPQDSTLTLVSSSLSESPVEVDEEDPAEATSMLRPSGVESSTPECFRTGAHHFLLPAAGPKKKRGRPTKDEVEGRCKLCGMTKEFPVRPQANRRTRGVHDRLSSPTRPSAPPVSALTELKVDGNALFDALCVVGSGTYSALSTLASAASTESWFAMEWARSLVALGHLDLEYNDELQPTSWQVSPSALVRDSDGWFLSGWRSSRLVDSLVGLANDWGFETQTVAQGRAPDGVSVVEIEDGADVEGLVEAVADREGVRLALAREVGPTLMSALPSMAAIRGALPTTAAIAGRGRLSVFSTSKMRWEPADRPDLPGLYRLERFGYRYVHFNGSDLRIVTSRLGKWLAAWEESRPIFAYDAATSELRCHRFSEPPGLFERALTLCSGRMDLEDERSRVTTYGGISPEVATLFASKTLRNVVDSAVA